MRRHAISRRHEPFHYFALETRLRPFFLFFQSPHQSRRVFRMLDQLTAKVVRFQIVLRTERMNNPHLVTGAAGSDIKTLFEEFLIAQGERTALAGIDHGDKHHVALVSLELRGIPAEYAMEFVAVGRDVRTDEIVDFDGLLIANQRNDSEA